MDVSLRIILSVLAMVIISAPSGRAGAAFDPGRWTVGGEIRERYEFREDADFDAGGKDTLSFVGSRIRLHMGYEVTPDLAFFFQMQDSRLLGSEASTASNEKNLDLHQGYLTVKSLAGFLTLTLGRQEMAFGDHRLVGNFGWSNIGRSFDGLRLIYARPPLQLNYWGMLTRQYGTNIGADPDPTKENRDGQHFHGLYTAIQVASLSMEPYVMYLRDRGDEDDVDGTGVLVSPITAPAARGQNRVTVGLRFNAKLMEDSIDFTGEAAYQLGTMDARGTTPKSDIAAYAFAVRAGYTLSTVLKPRIGIEYDRASGDDDPADDELKTFENLFPTNHPHYGYMDYVGWRNMQDLRFSIGLKPSKTSGVSLDYHLFRLAEKADHWYAASGKIFKTTPAGNSETVLGQEIDLVAYMMVKEKFRLEAGLSRFFPGNYVETNFPTATDNSDFVYLQAGVGF